MDANQYEAAERMRSEEAAINHLRTELAGEDECIVVCKAAEVLDSYCPAWVPDRRGLERFSLVLIDGTLESFVDMVRQEVLSFEDVLFERDAVHMQIAH